MKTMIACTGAWMWFLEASPELDGHAIANAVSEHHHKIFDASAEMAKQVRDDLMLEI
ncbi:hypothetical protein AB0F91_43935 [Amycolatopsis sp. NPDC023774]|uniref:hypothetical protein n=1 Tax=Amycolatopsis sp. NPDC023774 TaxID=3155015 RepID=UPI0033EC1E1C